MTFRPNRSSFHTICYTCPHSLDEILSQLLAHEAAYVLALVNLPEKEHSKASGKYTKPIRDIPEPEKWINMVASKGHAVHLQNKGNQTAMCSGTDIEANFVRIIRQAIYETG